MGWKAEPGMDLTNAPKAIRDAVEACAAEISRELNAFKLKSPDTETLQKIVDAGAGEHRDRLFSVAAKKAIGEFLESIGDMIVAHKEQFRAQHSTDGDDGKPINTRNLSN